jgi:hypothetical protein
MHKDTARMHGHELTRPFKAHLLGLLLGSPKAHRVDLQLGDLLSGWQWR